MRINRLDSGFERSGCSYTQLYFSACRVMLGNEQQIVHVLSIPTGEDILFIVADNVCNGNPENAARKILQDFHGGWIGPVALQLAPKSVGDDGQTYVSNTGLNDRVAVSPLDLRGLLRSKRGTNGRKLNSIQRQTWQP